MTQEVKATVRDPVCGMTLERHEAVGEVCIGSKTYCFCAHGCMEKFRRDPGRFLGPPDAGGNTERPAIPEASHAGRAAGRSCAYCGGEARAHVLPPVVGGLSLDEFESIVRGEWRRRLGRDAYTRNHSGQLVRALLLAALQPADPVRAAAVERQLLPIAVPASSGGDVTGSYRELRALSAAFWDVLSTAETSLDRAETMMRSVDGLLGLG